MGLEGLHNTKTTFHLFTSQPITRARCPSMQWRGQFLQRSKEYFPEEVRGEEDCDGPGQEMRNTSTTHCSSSLLARSRLSFCPSTSLEQQWQQCIYLMYLFQIQIFRLRFGWLATAGAAAAAQKIHDLSILLIL